MLIQLNPPTQYTKQGEMADYFEIQAIKNSKSSMTEVARHLTIVNDNTFSSGCDDEDDENAVFLDGILAELQRRLRACGNEGYPFTLNATGTVLTYLGDEAVYRCGKKLSYVYLLLSTLLNMTRDKTHAHIDGTTILEDLAAITVRAYLGARSFSINFGTSTRGGFESKVNHLCEQLGEGGRHKAPEGVMRHTQDGKLDTVGWIPFSDRRAGKLSVFGQCKTGTHWKDSICQLQPGSFIKKFMTDDYHLDPIRAFFVSESLDRSKWHDHSIDGGLLFDRCRIVDFCPELPHETLDKTKTWTQAALSSLEV